MAAADLQPLQHTLLGGLGLLVLALVEDERRPGEDDEACRPAVLEPLHRALARLLSFLLYAQRREQVGRRLRRRLLLRLQPRRSTLLVHLLRRAYARLQPGVLAVLESARPLLLLTW